MASHTDFLTVPGIAVGRSIRQIAQGLRRAPSTVSREIRRNGGSQAYRANRADRRARERALRPKPCRLALYSALRGTIGIFVCEAVFRHASTKRSLNITANCVFASNHSRGGRFQSAAAWFKTKYSS